MSCVHHASTLASLLAKSRTRDGAAPNTALVLGRLMPDGATFVTGVTKAQYTHILRRLRTNAHWDRVDPAGRMGHAATSSAVLRGERLDVQVVCVEGLEQVVECYAFEHKCWRFVLGQCQGGGRDRDDDRKHSYQVRLEPVPEHAARAGDKYLAQAGLLLAQDMCNMCQHL